MWTVCSFLLLLLCTAAPSMAHPKIEKPSSDLHAIASNQSEHGHGKNRTGLRMNASDVHHLKEIVATQNAQRPRFLVTYENVYKPSPRFSSPVDPFQNILLYFLMNFGRELSQSSLEQGKLHRPVEFFGPDKDSTREGHPPDELKEEEQNGEVHIFPHVGGTCMCFNNRRNRNQELIAERQEKATEDLNYCQRFNRETTELKTENHNVPSSNDSDRSTVAVRNLNDEANGNNTIIKVLRLAGHNKTSSLEATTKLSTAKNDAAEIVITGEEIVVDLQLTQDDNGANKHRYKKKTAEESVDSINKTANNIQHNATNTTRHDESYYFLSSSGGTDQRTTAFDKLTFRKPDMSTTHVEEKTSLLHKHKRDSKKRRKRVRRRLEKIERYLHENLNLRRNQKETVEDLRVARKKTEQKELKRAAVKPDENSVMVMLPMAKMEEQLDNMSDINGITNLKSVEEIIKYHNWAPVEQERKSQQASHVSNTIPTLLGIGTVLLIIGYVMKTKGWCHNLVSKGPAPMTTESAKKIKT